MENKNGVMQNGRMVFSNEVRIDRTATKSGRKYQQWVFVGWSPLPMDLTGEKAYMKGKYLMVEWQSGEVERWEVGEDFDLTTIKPEPQLDWYCMECGESVAPKAKKCDYCGCREIDVMEIEPEIDEPVEKPAQDAQEPQIEEVAIVDGNGGQVQHEVVNEPGAAFKVYDKITDKIKTFQTHDAMVEFAREKKLQWPVYLKCVADAFGGAEILAHNGEEYETHADLFIRQHDDGQITFGWSPDGYNGEHGFKTVNKCLKSFCRNMIEQTMADADDAAGCRCGGGGCINCRPRDYIDGWIY